MQGTMNPSGFFANIFHDVDFAALRPARGRNVFSEHPERGPDSLPFRDFYSRFEAAVSLRKKILCFESGGGVVARYAIGAREGFFLRGDDEIASFDARVLGVIGVGLEFVVAPAFAADVVGPFFGVWRRAVWAVEFVAPSQGPHEPWRRRRVAINITAGEKRNRAKECSAKDLGGIYAELRHANSKEHRLKSVLLSLDSGRA